MVDWSWFLSCLYNFVNSLINYFKRLRKKEIKHVEVKGKSQHITLKPLSRRHIPISSKFFKRRPAHEKRLWNPKAKLERRKRK
jgi:hypothetical protein